MKIDLNRRSVLLGAAVVAAAAGGARAVRPGNYRLLRRGDRLFLTALVNGHVVEALLDSAAEGSIADPRFAATLALGKGEAVTARGTGAAAIEARQVPHVRIEAAGVVVLDATIGVLDLGDIGRRLIGRPLQFIVGREIFDRARLAIDISGGTIAAVAKGRNPEGVRLPLTEDRGTMLLPMEIEGLPARATFDVGNGSGMLVSKRFAEAHLLDGRSTGMTTGGGFGGAKPMRSLTVRSLKLAGRTFTDVPVRIDDNAQREDANIGVGLLQDFRITTDYAEHAIWLKSIGSHAARPIDARPRAAGGMRA